MAQIEGTPGAETLSGTSDVDVISGLGGNDIIDGLGGADILVGGLDQDHVDGGDGNDVIVGGDGNDTLTGGADYDLLAGGAGDDNVDGGDGVDILALTGQLSDYLVQEVTAPTDTALGSYRIVDQRAGAPEGTDTFTGIEKLRFEIGGEVTLADALDRAPTDITLSRTPASVSEAARSDAFVAVLSGVDPDPAEQFTFSLIDDAGGRFKIDGDLLRVANSAFDFATNPSHTVTIRVTDGAENFFDKQVTIAVRDEADVLESFSAVLPADAGGAKLWELEDGGFIITWAGTANGVAGYFARRVNDSGATVDPQSPDRMLMATAVPSGEQAPRLLGVDDKGIAAFVKEAFTPQNSSSLETITWIDAATGAQIRSKTITQSRSSQDGDVSDSSSRVEAFSYSFDDDYVRYELISENDNNTTNLTRNEDGSFASSTSSFQLDHQSTILFENSLPQDAQQITGLSDIRFGYSFQTDDRFESRGTRTHISGGVFDITEDGHLIYAERLATAFHSTHRNEAGEEVGPVRESLNFALKGSIANIDLGEIGSHGKVFATAILDADRFAYILENVIGEETVRHLYFVKDGETVEAPTDNAFSLQALGSDRYLLTSLEGTSAGLQTRARVFDDVGTSVTGVMSFAGVPQFTLRDDGSFVAYTTRLSTDPLQPGVILEGEVGLAADVGSVTPEGGAFQDTDGDGDLDFTGTILVGENSSLRLEDGIYELTDETLKVTNATVFANIGEDTTSPLFRGSFVLDRNTGVASSFVMGQLVAGAEPFKIAGLSVTYRGLTVRKDSAAFAASFQFPTLLFDGGPTFDLNSPNALLVTEEGPELEGFEVPIGTGTAEFDTPWFNLFTAKAKNLKVRYDGAQDELAVSGELKVTSDIVDGLASLAGGDDVALTFKGMKIKDGKVDFEGELSAKKWTLGPIKLTDIKFAIKIDDDVVRSVSVEAGIELPFKQLNGLSFAGEVTNPPLELNKIGISASTTIALPKGFFLDKIGATLDGLAAAAPPTSFTGLLGIGWGPKLPTITFPDFLGIDEIKDARVVNVELSATTDWTTSVSGTGKINLIDDQVGKHTGSITWNFAQDTVTFAGAFDYFSGIVTGNASLRISELGVTLSGTGSMSLPNSGLFGPIAGLTFGSVTAFAQVLDDGNADNDVLAFFGTQTLPVIGSQTLGFKVDLLDGDFDLILGANDVPQTSSFDVLDGEDWLMIAAAWDNPVAGEVLTQVRTPEGTFLQEADYAANGVTIIDLFTGPTKKTIVIDNPRAGNWDLQVIDPSGLVNLDYSGFTPNAAVGITVGGVSLTLGGTVGQVAASLAGADLGTQVTFFADTDDAGLDGFALGATTLDADGAFTFDFNALTLSGGVYHIYAVADDGHGAPAFDYGGTFTVAQRPTDITLAPNATPGLLAASALIAETALPGAEIAALGVVTPDLTETHSFELLDDAGGRFAIVDDRLVVGTGAPFDAGAATSHTIVIRATTSRGLTFEETVTIEVGAVVGAPTVIGGLAAREVLLGTDRGDVFFDVSGEDTVIGLGEQDFLYLAGDRSDFSVVLDPTGDITGPVRAFLIPEGVDPDDVPPSPLDPAPPYVLFDDLRDAAGPIVIAGIEVLQFRDIRVESFTTPLAVGDGPYAGVEDTVLAIGAAAGLLGNDSDADGDALQALLVTGAAHGALTLNPDGSFTYTPAANYFGPDSFTYQANDGTADSNVVTVALSVGAINDAPTAINVANQVSIAENTSTRTRVAELTVDDVDTDPAFRNNVVTVSDSRFEIDPSDGFLYLKAGQPVDFEATSGGSIALTLTATDANNSTLMFSRTLNVTVTDVDEAEPDRDGDPLFDTPFYEANNPDVVAAGVNAKDHYNQFGWYEGRNPNPLFSSSGYLSANGDVRAAAINPVEHFRVWGSSEGRDPSASFDLQFYLVHAPDVKAAGVEALTHYLSFGQFEGRLTSAAVGPNIANGFDAEYYLLANPDVGFAGVDPLLHFNEFGWEEGRDPNAFFDSSGYLAFYTDVAAAQMNPLDHYMQFGWNEGRDPSAHFDTNDYLAANPDVDNANVNPLQHFLQFGLYEGRLPVNDGVFG